MRGSQKSAIEYHYRSSVIWNWLPAIDRLVSHDLRVHLLWLLKCGDHVVPPQIADLELTVYFRAYLFFPNKWVKFMHSMPKSHLESNNNSTRPGLIFRCTVKRTTRKKHARGSRTRALVYTHTHKINRGPLIVSENKQNWFYSLHTDESIAGWSPHVIERMDCFPKTSYHFLADCWFFFII